MVSAARRCLFVLTACAVTSTVLCDVARLRDPATVSLAGIRSLHWGSVQQCAVEVLSALHPSASIPSRDNAILLWRMLIQPTAALFPNVAGRLTTLTKLDLGHFHGL
jgi:hypothetical protein